MEMVKYKQPDTALIGRYRRV